MTPEQKSLAVWGGSALGLLIIGWSVLSWRSGELSASRARAATLQAELQQTWLPNDLKAAQSYAADLTDRAKRQEAALSQAAAAVVPALPAEYRATDLITAASRVRTDLVALRQRSERSRILLPGALPYESGLDADEQVRAMQLVGLCALRRTLELCLDAGVAKVTAVLPGKPFCDPAGEVGVFPIECEVEASPEAAGVLFQGFLAAHRRGLGLRAIVIEGNRNPKEATQRLRLTATLLFPAEDSWQLKPEAVAPAAKGAAGSTRTMPTKAGLGNRPAGNKP